MYLLNAPPLKGLQRNAPLLSLLDLRLNCREPAGVYSRRAAFLTLFAPPDSQCAVAVIREPAL